MSKVSADDEPLSPSIQSLADALYALKVGSSKTCATLAAALEPKGVMSVEDLSLFSEQKAREILKRAGFVELQEEKVMEAVLQSQAADSAQSQKQITFPLPDDQVRQNGSPDVISSMKPQLKTSSFNPTAALQPEGSVKDLSQFVGQIFDSQKARAILNRVGFREPQKQEVMQAVVQSDSAQSQQQITLPLPDGQARASPVTSADASSTSSRINLSQTSNAETDSKIQNGSPDVISSMKPQLAASSFSTTAILENRSASDTVLSLPAMGLHEIEQVVIQRKKVSQVHGYKCDINESVRIVKGLICDFTATVSSARGHGDRVMNNILVLGDTGCGKSTAVNYLLGSQMIEEDVDGRRVINVARGNTIHAEIGHDDRSSKTLVPKLSSCETVHARVVDNRTWFSVLRNVAGIQAASQVVTSVFRFVDFPGFHDSRGSEFNIANAVNLQSFVTHSKKVKLLLLFESAALKAGKGKLVTTTVNLLKSMFPVLRGGAPLHLGLIVGLTKVHPGEDVARNIRDLLVDFRSEGFILENHQVVVIDPLQNRRISFSPRDVILERIRGSASLDGDHFHIALPAEDENFLRILLEQMNSVIYGLLSQDRYNEVAENCNSVRFLSAHGFGVSSEFRQKVNQSITSVLTQRSEEIFRMVLEQLSERSQRQAVISKFKMMHGASVLNNLFDERNEVAKIIQTCEQRVCDAEFKIQAETLKALDSKFDGDFQFLLLELSKVGEHEAISCISALSQMKENFLSKISENLPALHACCAAISDFFKSEIPAEKKNRGSLYCFPDISSIEHYREQKILFCRTKIKDHVSRFRDILVLKEVECVCKSIVESIPSAIRAFEGELSRIMLHRKQHSSTFTKCFLPKHGFLPQDIQRIASWLKNGHEIFEHASTLSNSLVRVHEMVDNCYVELQNALDIVEFERHCADLQALHGKISKLLKERPLACLDSKEKILANGLTGVDWEPADRMEQKGQHSGSKARLYAQKHEEFMLQFQIEALDLSISSAAHLIAENCDRIPTWLQTLVALGVKASDPIVQRLIRNIEAGLSVYCSSESISKKVKDEDFAGLSSMIAVLSKLRTALHPTFITITGTWKFEAELIESVQKCVETLKVSALADVRHLFQSGLKLHTQRFKLRNIKNYCSFHRELIASPDFQESLTHSSAAVAANFKSFFEPTIESPDNESMGIAIVKFIYFVNLSGDVLGIDKSAHIELLKDKIKACPNISHVAESVLALSDHSDLGAAANEAVSTFPAFRHMNIQLYNKKAGQMTIAKVLTELQVGANSSLSSSERDALADCFAAYQKAYEEVISDFIAALDVPQEISSHRMRLQLKAKDEAISLAQKIAPIQNSPNICRLDIGKMLGLLFAAWTLLDVEESDLSTAMNMQETGSDSSKSAACLKESLLQPHATQIITIMRILGVDSSGVAENHLAEVKTGEGKSITLGALSIVFALFGNSVNVVCYNPYLSIRDWHLFKNLFTFFGLTSACVNSSIGLSSDKCCITYCTIDNLVSLLMYDGSIPDIREVAIGILSNRPSRSAEIKLKQQTKVLLIDEVDVFFGQDFFGQCQRVGMIVDSQESKDFLKYLFDNRAAILKNPDVEEIMRHDIVQKLTALYPRLLCDDILKWEIRAMLRDLEDFPADGSINHACVVSKEEQNIGYIDKKMAGVNFDQYFGYKTFFAYLYYCSTTDPSEKIDISANKRSYGLQLLAGSVLYSELPKCFGAIHGLSGTVRCLGQNESKILDEYKFQRRSYIPSTFAKSALSKLDPLSVTEVPDEHDFFHSIREEIRLKLNANRTTLIVFRTFDQLKRFHTYMQNRPIPHDDYRLPEVLHDEMNHAQRDGVICRSMNRHAITLMTKSFGRGTDFKCHNKQIDAAGGVHVILTYLPQSMSEIVQIQGRTCRQDYQGSYREMFWAQDLQELGFVTLSNGKINLEGHSDQFAMRDLLEAKRKSLDDRQVQEMFNELEANSKLWQQTCDMLQSSTTLPTLDAAFAILNEIQPCPAVQPIEVAFLFDATKSMGPYILAAKERVMKIANDVKQGVAAANRRISSKDLDEYVKFAFVGYRDWNASGKVYDAPGHVETFNLSSDIKSLRAFIEQVKPHGGGDLAEDVAGGLRAIESLKWSPDSAKCVFMLADAPCHGSQYHSLKDSFESSSVFNPVAGQTRFDQSVARDQFQNVVGSQFDLSPDGAFNGHIIAVYTAYTGGDYTFNESKAALEKKGFTVVLWYGQLPPVDQFRSTLEKCCQLWLISGLDVTLKEPYIQAVLQLVEAKKGLFIWGDNDPYYADANAIMSRLPFFKGTVSLAGNYEGHQVLRPHANPQNMRAQGPHGFKPHYITTGLESLFEGSTISDIRDPQQLCDPIITCSDGRSHVTSLYFKDKYRVLIDGGFTRLFSSLWKLTAGTARFVTNAACFLAAFEDKADNFPGGDPQGSLPERQIESLVSAHNIKFFFVNICREKTDQMISVWNRHLDSKKVRTIETFELDCAGANFLDSFAAQISKAILADYTSALKRQQ